MALGDGYAYVGPRGAEVARALLDLAEKAHMEPGEVRTTVGGYIVPVALAKRYEKSVLNASDEEEPEVPAEEPADEAEVPDDSWTNADIRAWAEDNKVDLGGATKKADMLAAITAGTEEE